MHHSNRCGLISCSAPLPAGKKYVAVEFLTKETVYFVVDVKSKGQELFDQICSYLGLNDSELFGLALFTGGEYQYIDLTLKITKFAPKLWKSQHGYGLDNAGKPLLNLYLRVQYYVDCHLLINDKITRHLYYLQLLHNVVTYSQPLSEERSFLLSAYALQADMGNFNSDKHKDRYFDPYDYFPSWIIKKLGEEYIIRNIPAMHRDNFSLSRGEAQVMYIKEASDSAAPHNLHFYKMHRKKTKNDTNVWIGICAKGVEVYEESSNGLKNKLSTFLWFDIAKLYFEKKKFEIRSVGCVEERKFTYYASSEELAKSLLWLCRMTHQFHMVTQPKVKELIQLELGGHKPYRETYIYSDTVDMVWEKKQRDHQDDHMNLPCSVSRLKKCSSVNNTNEQRVSVISSSSSNTTSGIVSDRIQNFDESEDELDLEMENLTPLTHQNLTIKSTCDRKMGNKISQDSFSQHSEQSLSTESGTGEQYPVCSDRRWNSLDKRVTPTSSMLSSSSYTSFTDSTHSSSSQLSAITVKANLISPRVGGNCCWQTCCSSIANHHCSSDIHNSSRIGFNASTATAPEHLPCHCAEHSTIPGMFPPKNGISKLSPQEIEQILEKQLQQRKACCDKKRGKEIAMPTLVPPSLLKRKTDSNTKLHLCKQFHAINTCCNKHYLEQTGRQPTSSLYSSAPVISPTAHIFGADASRNCISSVKCQSLPFHSLVYPGTSLTSHCHVRNATKIGVSSLTRGHRIPLSVFSNSKAPMTMAASEPNLCCSNIWPDCHSRLGMNSSNACHGGSCSSVQNVSCNDMAHPVYHHRSFSSNANSLHSTDSSSHGGINDTDDDPTIDFNNFPCIPPPLAYRTTVEKENVEIDVPVSDETEIDSCHQVSLAQKTPNSYFSKSLESLPSFIDSKQLTLKDVNTPYYRGTQSKVTGRTKSNPSIIRTASHSSEILDIQKLRQKSRDMDLPLISALCNDRSLLMLPKTVPTCSRQRHLGKDFRRFSCSYINPYQSENFKNLMEIGRAPSGSQSRPISWHLESADCMWLKEFPQYNTFPSVPSDENSSTTHPGLHGNNVYGSCHFNDLSQHLFGAEHSHMLCCQHSSAVLAPFNASDAECNVRNHAACFGEYETDVPSMPKQFLPINLSSFTQEDIPSGLYVKEQVA